MTYKFNQEDNHSNDYQSYTKPPERSYKLPEPVAFYIHETEETTSNPLKAVAARDAGLVVTDLHPESVVLAAYEAGKAEPDFRQMREMLRAMQAGELTVSRGIEILEVWWAGNWSNAMLPPVRQDLIEEDSMPVEIIDRQAEQLAAAQAENERLREALLNCRNQTLDGVNGTVIITAEEALATPASHDALREHDAKLVERIASMCEKEESMQCDAPYSIYREELIDIADKIRKGEF